MSERQHTHHAHYAGSLARPFHNEQVIFKRALGQGPGPLRKGPLGPKNSVHNQVLTGPLVSPFVAQNLIPPSAGASAKRRAAMQQV
jgi:hypothetical protein